MFTHSTLVDRMAAMLNYFLSTLVGPKQRNLKVSWHHQNYCCFFVQALQLVILSSYINVSDWTVKNLNFASVINEFF